MRSNASVVNWPRLPCAISHPIPVSAPKSAKLRQHATNHNLIQKSKNNYCQMSFTNTKRSEGGLRFSHVLHFINLLIVQSKSHTPYGRASFFSVIPQTTNREPNQLSDRPSSLSNSNSTNSAQTLLLFVLHFYLAHSVFFSET